MNSIANWITTIPNAVGFIDLRSYGQMREFEGLNFLPVVMNFIPHARLVSTPFSHSCSNVPKDAENLVEAALGAVRAIKNEHGMKYAVR